MCACRQSRQRTACWQRSVLSSMVCQEGVCSMSADQPNWQIGKSKWGSGRGVGSKAHAPCQK